MNKIISFPHLGNYYIPIKYLISNSTRCKVLIPPPITKKTIKLGSKYSPDYVCVPFKYNLGNYIEALDNDANIILQAGGGCRYGYYAELQEKILKDLNYEFEFINFMNNNHVSIQKIYKFAKKLNPKLNIFKLAYYGINTILMIIIMDKLSKYPRENIGFEIKKNSFINTEKSLLNELKKQQSDNVEKTPQYVEENWQDKVDEFLKNHPTAKNHTKAIAELLASDKVLANNKDSLEIAYSRVLEYENNKLTSILKDENHILNSITPKIKEKIVNEYLKEVNFNSPFLINSKGGNNVITSYKKPLNMIDAGEMAKKIFK